MDRSTEELLEAFALRIERSADLADRRARDADRISRWTVGVSMGVAAVILSAVFTLAWQVARLDGSVQALADRVQSLENHVLALEDRVQSLEDAFLANP